MPLIYSWILTDLYLVRLQRSIWLLWGLYVVVSDRFFQLQVKQNQIITKYSVLTIIFIGKVCIIYNVKSTFSVQAVVTWSCARAPSRVSNALSCLSARTMPICPFHSVHRIDDESNKLPILSFHIRSDIISCVRAGKSRHCSRCRF